MVKLAKKKHGKSFVPGKMPVYRTVIYSSIINKIVSFPLGGSLCSCYLFTIYMGKLVGCRLSVWAKGKQNLGHLILKLHLIF